MKVKIENNELMTDMAITEKNINITVKKTLAYIKKHPELNTEEVKKQVCELVAYALAMNVARC